MNSNEAYNHIRRAGWRENVIIRTMKEFTFDGAVTTQTTITSTEFSFTCPTTGEACQRALEWTRARIRKECEQRDNSPCHDRWRFADREASEQREREQVKKELNALLDVERDEKRLIATSNLHPIFERVFEGVFPHVQRS